MWAGAVRKSDPLNANQLNVLRRIAMKEDVGVDSAAKTSARALHGRGLVVVSTRGGWHAKITDAGSFYLDHGHHPDRPCDGGALCMKADSKIPSSDGPSATSSKRRPPHTTARIAALRRAAAADLMAKLVDETPVVISNPDEDEIAEWRKVVDFAKRNGMVPAGKRIEKSRWYNGDLHIVLRKGAHPNAKPPLDPAQRIEVPEQVDELHPLLTRLKDPASVLDVSAEQLPRALRIMHSVLVEAEHRGYNTGWTDETAASVQISSGSFRLYVTMTEELEKRDVVPTAKDLASKKVYDWQRFQPETKSVRSGKLRLQVATEGRRWDRSAWWADRQRWTVEDKVGEILAEITKRITAEQDRIAAEEQEKLQRQRDWEAAMANARVSFQEHRRVTALNAQLERWQNASAIRNYCNAVEATRPTGDAVEETHAQSSWLEWCRSYADQIDPVRAGAGAPKDIEPGPSDLQPYLGKFSAYGP